MTTTLDRPVRRKVDPIRVFSDSHPYPLAEDIVHIVRAHGIAEIQAMGAGAVTQTIKALSIAYGYLLSDGIETTWKSELADIVIREYEWAATRFIVERQP